MILFETVSVNIITQEEYESALKELCLSYVECPDCHHHSLIFHSTYSRGIKQSDGVLDLIVQRVLCRECGHTHALLPASLIPYCQIILSETVQIIQPSSPEEKEQIMRDNPSIDESDIGRILKKWITEWRERLKAFCIDLSQQLTPLCFSSFRRQFLQNHCSSSVGLHETT